MPSPLAIARTLAAGRALLGAALLVAPDRVTRRWVGAQGQTPAGRILARGLGARDAAIGVGLLASPTGAARSWIAAGLAADAADLAASGSSSQIPPGGRIGTAALAGGSGLLGAWLLTALD